MSGNGFVDFDEMPMHRAGGRGVGQWSVGSIAELVIHLALVALFIWAVVTIVNYLVKYLNTKSSSDTAEDYAKKRFAQGEITRAEYEQLKKDLK